MKIAIISNRRSGKRGEIAVNKFKSLLCDKQIEYFDFDGIQKPDLIAIFGGDGTILSNTEYATENQIPILAINVGTVGYLSSFEDKDLETAVEKLSNGNYSITEKSVLSVETSDGDKFIALNDAVVERGRFSNDVKVIAKLRLIIDGNAVYKMSGDGLIVATPTGSTAYSLSSGGVILTPDLNSFIATPVSPHSLNTKPIVYRDDKKVQIEILQNSCDCVLCIDGRSVKTLVYGDTITVNKYNKRLKIIDSCENFYKKLIKKLG